MASYRLRDLEAEIRSVENHPYKYLWFRCPQPHCQGTYYDGSTHWIGWKLGSPWEVIGGSTIDDLSVRGSLRVLNENCKGHWNLANGILADAD